MKLIIDIPEDKYEWLKKNNPNADTNSIVGAIANGIPYEERTQGDLISREALIKWIDDSVSQYYGTYSTDMLNMWELFKDYLINNAPTVAVDNYYLGYQDGLEKGAETTTEGEWIHYLGCGVGKAVCSVCGQLGETKKYCGNCGRRMGGGYS